MNLRKPSLPHWHHARAITEPTLRLHAEVVRVFRTNVARGRAGRYIWCPFAHNALMQETMNGMG